MTHLKFARSGDDTFRLLSKIKSRWREIGATLQVDDSDIVTIEEDKHKLDDKILEVFRLWIDNASGLPGKDDYPHTWQGLYNILQYSELKEVANQYFEFLNKGKL